nr:unnamed protein product [Callosobruchus analis]
MISFKAIRELRKSDLVLFGKAEEAVQLCRSSNAREQREQCRQDAKGKQREHWAARGTTANQSKQVYG